MANHSDIEWTEATWKSGHWLYKGQCGRARTATLTALRYVAGRWAILDIGNGFKLTLTKISIDLPKRWRESRLIFVNSMSDLFHEQVHSNSFRACLRRCAHAPSTPFKS